MAQATIGALRATLGLNSAQFSKGMKNARADLRGFGQQVRQVMTVAAAAAAAAGGAMTLALRGAANQADELAKASKSIGVPIEQLSALKHAADLSGVSFANLSTGMRKGAQTIQQAIDGASNEGSMALNALGVSLTDTSGNIRSMTDILDDVADKFAAMPDGVTKTAAAMGIFGRAGAQLIPMLNTGSAGIREMTDEAQRLGLVIDQETGVYSEQFNDNLTRLSRVMTGMWNQVLSNVIPAFAQLTDKFVAAATEGGRMEVLVNGISNAMLVMARGVSIVFDHLGDLYDLFKLWIGLKVISFLGSLTGGLITLSRVLLTTGLSIKALTAITRAKITALLLVGAVITKLTGHYEDLEAWVIKTSKSIHDMLPPALKEEIGAIGNSIKGLTEDVNRLGVQSTEGFMGFLDAQAEISGGINRLRVSTDNAGKGVSDLKTEVSGLNDVSYTLQSSFQSAFDGIIDGTFEVGRFLSDLSRQLTSMLTNRLFSQLFSGGGGGLFGFSAVPTNHSGGQAGVSKQYRAVSPGALAGAKKFHSGKIGVKHNEVMALLEKSESVFTADQTGRIANALGRSMSGGNSVLQVQLSPDLEARVLEKSAGQSIQIVQASAPGIVDQSVAATSGAIKTGQMDASMGQRFGVGKVAKVR